MNLTISCGDLHLETEQETFGEVDFQIINGNTVHHFLTRRNFEMEICGGWIQEWRLVIGNEDIVCISGEHLSSEVLQDSQAEPLTHHHWLIDRMKSKNAEWSYFYRGEN